MLEIRKFIEQDIRRSLKDQSAQLTDMQIDTLVDMEMSKLSLWLYEKYRMETKE
jgi:hypothetical protein